MSVTNMVSVILKELAGNQQYLIDEQLRAAVDAVMQAKHIFTAGTGRSGVAVRAFTNRLMHLGYAVSSIGEITTPHSGPGDLMIIASGSGETQSLVSLSAKARKGGVKILLFTMAPGSSIAKAADVVCVLPGVSPKLKDKGEKITSVQPMGSAFEQMAFLVFDAMILELMERTGQTSDDMYKRHADLE